jgi:hypothetical protein
MKKEELIERYLAAVKHYKVLEIKEERLLLILSVSRLVSFIGSFILIWIGFTASVTIGFLSLLILSALFFVLLKLYSKHSEKKMFLGNLGIVNQNEADALSGNLSAFDAGRSYTDTCHDFSYDVDLFGNSSLFQYLNRTITGYGRDILAGWLSDPFILSKEIISRQEAIKELELKEKWRQEFME